MLWLDYWEVSTIPCPTFWIDCGGLDISLLCNGVCSELIKMLNYWKKIIVWVLSNCALCVVCECCMCGSWWVCDKEIHGHDLLMFKRMRSEGSNSWKPTKLKLAVT
jgi:hypothetical protein